MSQTEHQFIRLTS